MKTYEYPAFEIVLLEEADVIATSLHDQLEREDYAIFDPNQFTKAR